LSDVISPLWSGRLALVTSLVLALAIVWLLVRMVWLLVAGVEVTPAPMPPVPQVIPSVAGGSGEFRWDLFGRTRPRPAMTSVAPVSNSRLRLKGVVAGRTAYAIIAGEQGAEEVYREGDELPDGGRVDTIEPRRVLIVRNGQTESLALDDSPAATQTSASRSSSAVPEGGVPLQMPGIRGFQAPAGVSVAGLADVTGSLGIDAGKLAGAVTVMPVSGGGYRVRPGRDARLFAELGLQVNDIVKAVNGQPLESRAAVQNLFSDVLGGGEITITVQRQGREVTLRPDVAEILESLQQP